VAGIVSRLPFPLSGRTVSQSAQAVITDVAYDFAIAGQLFLSASSDQNPMTRSLAPIRKQQFDNAREPGEQSLVDWWLRSQATFIGGEGLLYQDPDQVGAANLQNRHTIRYGHSVGLNPWTDGQLTMLRSTTLRVSDGTSNPHFVMGYNDGTDRFWSAVGANFKTDDGTTTTAITYGGAGTILSATNDGTNYYVADSASIWRGTGSGAGADIYNTATSKIAIAWVKGRLMAGVNNLLYELVTAGPALAAGDLRFTHLNSAWQWTSISDGPNAIYAAGFAGSKSSIYKFQLTSTGAAPTLSSGGTISCELPNGEIVNKLITYLGSFVGICTTRGFRVGQIDTNGDIAYGPLLLTGDTKDVGAFDRFFFVGGTNAIDGQSGLWRIDLGQPIQDNGGNVGARYAYATDLQAHQSGTVWSVTNFGNSDRMVFSVQAHGAYLESASVLEPTGYFESARIRFNTQEPKIFKFLSVKTPLAYSGSLTASIEDTGGGTTSVIEITEGSGVEIESILLSVPPSASEWVKLRLDFQRSGTDTTKGMVVNGWQFKVIPGATRQRVFVVPLYCFDFESDKNGQKVGSEDRTLARLEMFESVAQKGDSVNFQDMQQGRSYLVVIEDYKFEQKAEPGPNFSGYGGVLTVQLRTLNDVVT
jgi:hypothetical protein